MLGHDFYLELKGTPRDLGLAHGETFRSTIQSAIARWQQEMSDAAKMPFEKLLGMFNAATDYRAAIEQWTPHIYEEMQYVAKGANVSEELIYAWQLVDEFIDFLVEYIYIEKCTTVGGYDQGVGLPPVIGKTQDLPHCYIGAAALIRTRYADSDIDILNSTIAGIVCQDGMSPNLGLCLNHVGQLARSSTGLPVTFVTRLILERCSSIKQAADLLGEITHASGMNYGFVDKQATRTFEASANHVVEFLPAPELKRIWHTNHPLVNTNVCRDIQLWNRLKDEEAGSTVARMGFMDREASLAGKPLSPDRVMELLSSREVPVSSLPEDPFPTINSIVMEFGEQPVLHFAPGPPSETAYIPFRFDSQ